MDIIMYTHVVSFWSLGDNKFLKSKHAVNDDAMLRACMFLSRLFYNYVF